MKHIMTIVGILIATLIIILIEITQNYLFLLLFIFIMLFFSFVYYPLKFKKINSLIEKDFENKNFDQVIIKLLKIKTKCISIGEYNYCLEQLVSIYMIIGDEQKAIELLNSNPMLKRHINLYYTRFILSIAANDVEKIKYYYHKIQNKKYKHLTKQREYAKAIMKMLETNTFDEELYNNTTLPLLKRICENIKDNINQPFIINNIIDKPSQPLKKSRLTIILNIIAASSLWIGLILVAIINISKTNESTTLLESAYYMEKHIKFIFLALPLPLSCLILGILRSNKYKAKSNIILGTIFTVLIILFGSIGFISNSSYTNDPEYINFVEEKTLLTFPEETSFLFNKNETFIEGIIRPKENYETIIINNQKFSSYLTIDQRDILNNYYLTLTIECDYFYLHEVNPDNFLYLAYDIEQNLFYLFDFSILQS